MRNLIITIVVMSCVVSAGCTTHLQSTKPVSGGITHGVVYNLPELHYDIEVRRTLTRCPEVPNEKFPNPVGQIQFDISATATARIVAGPEIVIDYESLSAPTKTTEFQLERHASGILKSVNAKVDDRTSEVAAQAFKAVVSVGKIAIGLPSGGATGTARDVDAFIACSTDAKQALESIPRLRKDVKDKAAVVQKSSKALADFEAAHTASPRPADQAAEAAKLTRARLAAAEALDAANKALADSIRAITIVSNLTYVPGDTSPEKHVLDHLRMAKFRSCANADVTLEEKTRVVGAYNTLADETTGTTQPESIIQLRTFETNESGNQQRWLVHSLGPELTLDCDDIIVSRARWADAHGKPTEEDADSASDVAKSYWNSDNAIRRKEILKVTKLLESADVVATVHPLVMSTAPLSLDTASHCAQTGGPRCGILYRTKMPGRLRICRYTQQEALPLPDSCHSKSAKDPAVLLTDERLIPQLGTLASLSLRNGPFANNELSAEFSEDGTLMKMGYKKPRAEAVAIGETVNSGLDSLTTLMMYAKGEELRDLADEKKLNDARVALLNSQTALQQPSETTALQNEASLLKARRELIEAEIALRKRQAELDALNTPIPDDDSP